LVVLKGITVGAAPTTKPHTSANAIVIQNSQMLECSLGAPLEYIVMITTVFIYFKKYRQMVAFSTVSSVRIRVRFSFIGSYLYTAMAPPKLH